MANLFDQYERETRPQSGGTSGRTPAPPPGATMAGTLPGVPNKSNVPAVAKLEEEVPIFLRQRINFDPLAPISHLCACNNYLVMGLSNNQLTRVEIDLQAATDEIELTKSIEDSIFSMYLDPTGRHIIVSMNMGDTLYISRGSRKLRTLGKLKGHKITSVAWNRQAGSDQSTGEILLGTSKGLIFETLISSADDARLFSGSTEHYVKQVFSFPLAKEKASPITGLEFDRFPPTSLEQKYFIMATIAGRLYQFVGSVPAGSTEPPIFSHVFARFEQASERFLELPGSLPNSRIALFHPKPRAPPCSFAWLTGAGIYCGRIDLTGQPGPDNVTMETKLIQYKENVGIKQNLPVSMALTEFHVLLLFPDRVRGVCCLNEQTVYSDDVGGGESGGRTSGALLGMCRDSLKGVIWAYNSRSVFKFRVIREARDVWPLYLERCQFDLARKYCQESEGDMNSVLVKEAEHLFTNQKYEESARIYADTQCSFEEVTLRFVALEDKRALNQFLTSKLFNLKPQEKTQFSMLVVWLTELWLNELGQLKEAGHDLAPKYDRVQEDFRKFLNRARIKECVTANRNAIYQLITSHGDVEDMVFFAFLIQDYERVITHHIQQESYRSALEVLSKQNSRELFYNFSPQLMQNVPTETVDAWIDKRDLLDPRKLIPALVQCDASQGEEAIRYLEYCVQQMHVKDESIHNYLLSLYAKLKPDRLMKYLIAQGQEADQICYDLKYALRLCSQLKQQRACVHIYSAMGLYDEAVDLALQVDVDLAKQNANKPEDNEELKKKLWLKIARHVVEKEQDIKRAMEFLHECELLKIEDILPFFPDFVTIDHFKDAICTSLQEYSQHIETLKEEMTEATDNASAIKSEIQAFRNKFSLVHGQDKCSSCAYPLMVRAFYLFPCSHKFHADCLTAEVLPHLPDQLRAKANDLLRKIAANSTLPGGAPPLTTNASSSSLGGLVGAQGGRATPPVVKGGGGGVNGGYKEALDDIIAAECCYCGDIMIRCVDQSFINEDEYDSVTQSWL